MRSILKMSLLLGSLVSSSLLYAGVQEATPKIKEAIKKNFPEITVQEVSLSPVKGIYQVSAGSNILYVSEDGHYAFSGDLIDLQNRQNNLTEELRKKARVKEIKELGEENMIVFSPKNPKYTVTVFTDVDCGYCRQLQTEMKKINDLGITIRYVAFPRSGPSSPTFGKMVEVWCAKDKKEAISLAKQGKSIPGKTCSNDSVMKDFKVGLSMGVMGTPTLVFEDGTIFPGYLPPEKLLEAAEQLAKQKGA